MAGFALRAGRVAVGLVTVAVLAPSPAAVQAPQEQRPIFRGGANVVRVDVTVTNRQGAPVTDLTREDFEVTEDGLPQTIDSFELTRATGEPTDNRSLEIRSPEHAATEAGRDDVRLFLIFWDEYHIGEFIPALRGREVLTEFVRTALGPTDLVGIMDQLTTVDSIRFTRDPIELANQVHALKGRFGVLVPPRSPVEEAQLRFGRDIPRLRNEVTTSALASAAAFLGNFRDGRKAILFVSQGFPIAGRDGEMDQYNEILRAANTNNTAIYTIDPASEIGRRPDSLLALAYDTGGRAFVGSNRPASLLPQMVHDASVYYLLGYTSPAPVDGKFHKIKVRLKKGGYEVRARSGYFAPTVGDLERGRAKAEAARLPADVEAALGELSATARADRAVDVWIGMARGESGRTRVTFAWAPKTSSAAAGEVALTISAAAPGGASYFTATRTTSRGISFEAPAGDLVIATTALDGRGNEIDGDMRRVAVPAFDDSRLAIGSPVVLRARNARDARAITAGTDLHPEVGREFDRTDRLFIRVPVYGGGDLTVTARLLNRQGTELRTLPLARAGDDLYLLDLPLSASARGDYLVAIAAARGTESIRVLVPIRVR